MSKYYDEDNVFTYTNTGGRDSEDIGTARKIISKNLTGIFGMPFQFLGSVDPRITDPFGNGTPNNPMDNENFGVGSIYSEKIVARMPLLFLVPCRQKFMENFSDSDRNTVLNALVSGIDDVSNVINTLDKSGRYYTTVFDTARYFNHVNMMCAELAVLMGIGDKEVPVGSGESCKVKNIDWSKQTNSAFDDAFYAGQGPIFYVDGADNLSENFSNSSTESSLASAINQFSDQAKEIKFLLGSNSALGALVDSVKSAAGSLGGGLSGAVDSLAGGMLADLSNTGITTIINGGKLLFPKIWQDSSFDRSYSFEIKLRSPDHDNLSIFLNIMVPFIHLLCMVLPEGMDNGQIIDPNGYMTPFLCKAYMKGMFNIDMGLITNMSATRGATAQWNDDGLPTQMDISITIEDLYSGLALTARAGESSVLGAPKRLAAVVGNTAMMDYLSNLAGINVGDTEIGRRSRLLYSLITQDLRKIPSRKWASLDNGLNNIIANLYRTF